MNRNRFVTLSRRTATGIGIVTGGAFVAAMMSLGAAGAANAAPTDPYIPFLDPYAPPDPYDVLFGAYGQQGIDNNDLDTTIQPTPSFDSFWTSVQNFESSDTHGLENLIFALDPQAFYEQIGGGAIGTLNDGAYLVPDDGLGYLATGLDYGLLSPLGLEYVLTPVLNALAGTG